MADMRPSPEPVNAKNAPISETIPIYTIGYGARDIKSFTELLLAHRIAFLIDVRSEPYSRYKPEFSKSTLQASLSQAGIRYVFMGDQLGGRPRDEACYVDGKVDYEVILEMPFYQAGIERLERAFEQQHRVALMCSEGKPEQCHRSRLIGETLDQSDIDVMHIDENGELKSQDEVLSRLDPDPVNGNLADSNQPGLFDTLSSSAPSDNESPEPHLSAQNSLPEEPPFPEPEFPDFDPNEYDQGYAASYDDGPPPGMAAHQTLPPVKPQLDADGRALTGLPDDPMSAARSTLKSVFGYDDFWPLQAESIANIFKRRDTLIIMPTGGGKSLCFQLPALIFPGMSVVVSPLISLMQDQVSQLLDSGVAAAYINSTLAAQEQSRIMQQARNGEIKLLYMAPETLLRPEILVLLDDCKIDCLAIDEAHCISSWGHDFRPEYRQLRAVRDRLPQAICVALTATATPRVQTDIAEILGFSPENAFIGSFNRENLFLAAEPRLDGMAQLLNFLSNHRDQSGIIYCSTRKDVEGVAYRLGQLGWSALPYHAGLDSGTRRKNQEDWVRDNVPIMVATVAFGMGIDKSNVRFVAHYNLPQSVENYYQEIGRAGRDGLRSDCLLLYSVADMMTQRFFIDSGAESEKAGRSARLQAMWRYAEAQDCRRIPLLAYFGETLAEPCGHCDGCQRSSDDAEQVDVTVEAQKFLSCVKRTGERFGASHIINVLRGSQAKKILQFGHDKLSTYAIGLDHSTAEWKDLAQQFIAKGLLEQDMKFGSLQLTERGYNVLQGETVTVIRRATHVSSSASGVGAASVPQDIELFNRLRALRKQLADEVNLPAYIVFSDRALVEMATYFPQDESQLLAINGVGDKKLERYGEPFLDLLKTYCGERDIQPVVKGAPMRAARPISMSTPGKKRFEEVGERFVAGESVEEIRAGYGVKMGTVIQHLARYQQAGYEIDGQRALECSTLSEDEQERVFTAFEELGVERLSPIYEELGKTISYDELHLLRFVHISRFPND